MKSEEQVSAGEKTSPIFDDKNGEIRTSSSDAEIGHGEVEGVERTKRGLKARHAQMIALGGTIATFAEIWLLNRL
jgi:amino acid transporter